MIVILIFSVILIFYISTNEPEPYVYYNNTYYRVSGAQVNGEQIEEYVGETKRKTFRSIFNKNGNSNACEAETRICVDKNNQLCVELKYKLLLENGELKTIYCVLF